MKQIIIKQGQAVVDEVPAPLCEPKSVLVQVEHSCISVGTEMTGISMSGAPLWKRALKQPENVSKVIKMISQHGIRGTRQFVKNKLQAGNATGYSAAGIVLAVGDDITEFNVGDRVACAGAECAHHAEVIRVPQNLCCKVPETLPLHEAATVTLGAIALQGVRRANPTLGETFAVIGLGILGQLTCQLLKSNGARVIALDLDQDRVKLAEQLGADYALNPADNYDEEQVCRLTDGIGADGVIITAATPDNQVMASAFQMCRKKGRVVLVGDVGLKLNRQDFYSKELDFYISCSYGPGRYDEQYEAAGLDYPVGYVRWTENRNMSEYLRLLAEKRVNLAPLKPQHFPLEQAKVAYKRLSQHDNKPLLVLLDYPQDRLAHESIKVFNPQSHLDHNGKITTAIIGCGGFAKAVHIPNLTRLHKAYYLHAFVSRTGHNAQSTAKQYAGAYGTTDYQAVLDDPTVNLVLITTRHHLHGHYVLRALQAQKHVLVEKPLALTRDELEQIARFYREDPRGEKPLLLTGFNRRFSPLVQTLAQQLQQRSHPMIINYRMNAGFLAQNHWVHGPEGGGRNRGEACHIYDLFTFLINSQVTEIQAIALQPKGNYYSAQDNFNVQLRFADGSLATLTYTALGNHEYPKEQCDIFCDGRVYHLNDYRSLTITGRKEKKISLNGVNKGHYELLKALSEALCKQQPWPIPWWQQYQATDIALQVEQQISPESSTTTDPLAAVVAST